MTPDAGPESSVSTGRAAAASTLITPPLDLVEKMRQVMPAAAVFSAKVSK